KKQVIQGLLLTASAPAPTSAPVAKVTNKRDVEAKKKPPQKKEIKKQVVEKPRQAPQPKQPEVAPAERSEPVMEKVAEQAEPEVVEPIVEAIAEQAPQPQPDSDVEPLETLPPRIDDAGHLNNPPPSYPRLSKRLREEGEVILELWVLEDGSVAELKVNTSSGYPRLDKAALKAVKQWRYTPASRNGEAVAYRYLQPIQFSMK
ncbi:MAG TPA: energy transducer TonB, partial [Candidatus Tenderia electrophaga]|nr:energy transducer TonB [Candidatus Tenderia electrophaga]